MFDDTVDGNGDPMHDIPSFRQDLAAPYGSENGGWPDFRLTRRLSDECGQPN